MRVEDETVVVASLWVFQFFAELPEVRGTKEEGDVHERLLGEQRERAGGDGEERTPGGLDRADAIGAEETIDRAVGGVLEGRFVGECGHGENNREARSEKLEARRRREDKGRQEC